MNAQQAENLRILIRHMETRCARVLNMQFVLRSCGTPGCALGEATTIPALRAEGLVTASDADGIWLHGNGEVFGLRLKDSRRLFGGSMSNAWKRDDVSPQEWAIEARKVLTEHGYSMDATPESKPEPFKAFMAKALEPVAVEA